MTLPVSGVHDGGEAVDQSAAVDVGHFIKKVNDGVKVLGNGDLTRKLTVEAAAFTASAKEKIEKAGGKAEVK